MTTAPNPGPTRASWGLSIDSRIGAATTRAPAASKVDSHPQAILKFHHSISLDYRAHHGLPVISKNYPEFLHEIHDSILINVIEQPFHSNYSAEVTEKADKNIPCRFMYLAYAIAQSI